MQVNGVKRKVRRSYSAQFKAQVVGRCVVEPVSRVALGHGINPVTVHRWIREAGAQRAGDANSARAQAERFVPVALPHTASALMSPPTWQTPAQAPRHMERQPEHQPEHSPEHLHMEFALAGQAVRVSWPVAAAGQAAAWLRELLR
jgi:transposase-like protein